MKKFLFVILFVFVFPFNAHGEIKVWGLNGENWIVFTQEEKFIYVGGVFDALVFREKGNRYNLTLSTTYVNYIDLLDKFYKNPENIHVCLIWGLRVVSLRIENKPFKKELKSIRKNFSIRHE